MMQGPGRIIIDHSKEGDIEKPVQPMKSVHEKQLQVLNEILAELKKK